MEHLQEILTIATFAVIVFWMRIVNKDIKKLQDKVKKLETK